MGAHLDLCCRRITLIAKEIVELRGRLRQGDSTWGEVWS